MATTIAPIDIEKILLEGAEPLPETKKRLPEKPPINEALRNYYNSTAPPGSRQLAPGETPLPVSTEVEGPPAPGIMNRLPSLPSFGVAPTADRSIAGTASPLATTPVAPITKGPTVAPTEPTFPTDPLAAQNVPGAKAATPVSTGDKPSGWYDTLQRHTGFVRDVAEAGGSLLAGAGAFTFGAATAVSDILNAQLSRVARGGPMAGGPESSTHYRDIFARMDKTITALTPEPRSDVAKNVQKGVGAVTGLVKDIAELPGKGLVAIGIMNEDTAKVLSFATEFYLLYKLDRGVREVAPELRSKVADFKTRMSKAKSDADVAGAANDLADAAAKNPKVNDALGEARGKFRDEADREAGRGPREPQPEGPAPGGAQVEFTPEELGRYTDALNKATADFRAARPEGFTIEELRTHLDANVPKPQGTPRPAPEAPRPAEPAPAAEAARPAPAEPTRVTPTGDIVLSEDLRSYVDGQLAAGMPIEQIVRNVRPSVRGDISDVQIREAIRTQTRPGPEPARPAEPIVPPEPARDPLAERRAAASPPTERVTVDDVISGRAEPAAEMPARSGPAPVEPTRISPDVPGMYGAQRQRIMDAYPRLLVADPVIKRAALEEIRNATTIGETLEDALNRRGVPPQVTESILAIQAELARPPVEAAATVAPETVPAPVSPETPAVAATPPSETIAPPAARARELYESANVMGVTDKQYKERLAELKSIAREGLKPNQSARANLEKLGFTPEEIPLVEKQLKGVRAKIDTYTLEGRGQSYEVPATKIGDNYIVHSTALPGGNTDAYGQKAVYVVRNTDGSLVRGGFATKKAALEFAQERPAVQTAATEAVLDTAPVGTEVEIPRPAEPVVDSSPAIEKPKRARRVVKAPAPVAEQAPRAVGDQTFTTIDTVPNLETTVRGRAWTLGAAEPTISPMQVRSTSGKPDAVFVDTARMNTRTSIADIEKQLASGRMGADTADILRSSLERQSQVFNVPIEEAHGFTGTELLREATRVAAENDLDLYVKKGKNYELVPKDVVRTDARLNNGDDLAPKSINKEDAGAYVESKTSDIGPDAVRGILEAIEKGIDVTERLPAELVPHYKQMRETERAGIDTSERRAFIDILTDFNIMLGEEGSIGGSFGRAQRMAAQRLQADMRKAGKTVREFLFGARPEDVAMFESYLETINNPAPLDSTNPRNMRFDPENIIPGDKIIKQRSVSKSQGLDAVPLWQSEVRGIQNARDIKAGGTTWDMLSPLRQHKAAGTEFIYYSYRTSQKNLNAEIGTLQAAMTEIGRGFSSRSLENIGANGYARQGADGQRILTYNKVTPQPLTLAERRLQSNIDGIYRVTENRLNEARVATGREPLDHIDDYQTFARTFNILGSLGIKIDLTRATNAEINAAYIKHRATNFPYLVRKHAAYSAEMNALKILDTYMQSALKDIHMSPFLAKVHELIETNLPDPVTGKETWSLKDHKEGLYNELRRWNDFLATGTNASIPEKPRLILNTLNKNIAYATLSGLIRSAGIQLSTLVNTQQAFGPVNTFNGIVANFTDHLTGGKKREFALAHSEILSSRKFIEAYNELTAAIIGRRPRDFFHAVRTGDFGSIQAAVGRPGFKLMEIFDMEAAVTTWNIGYKLATKQLGYNHKEAKRFADDGVVRTQGSTMPGDLTGIQRNALGKVFTQFQTFLINDFNFLRNEVLSKQRTGGGGGGQIPPGGVASGTGDWSKGGKPSTFKLIGNIIQLLAATQLVNELYKLMHIQPAQPDPVEDFRRGSAAGHGPAGLAWDLAVGQIERVPIIGGALRYGSGITGPATEAVRDLTRAARNDPMTRNPYEEMLQDAGIPEPEITSKVADPATRLLGIPYTRQASKTLLGLKRGASVYDSLMGWQGEQGTSRERRESREQRPRSERRR